VYNHSTYWKTVKFITDNLFLIAISLISAGALFFPGLQRRGARVTQLQATQYMNQPKTVVLDVRSAEEFASGHLQNAKNIPVAELADKVKELEKSKNQIIITVCETGVRSGNAVSILNKAGFEQAFSLEGGIAAWKSQGLPTIK
jgi:rhodanese-related sulfurtransferase